MPSSRPINYKKIFDAVEAAKEIWTKLAADEDAYATDQARVIFSEVLPVALERFVRKNADYGSTAKFLGARGQFADINPKFWKLKRALWDGEQLIGESTEEILYDLIGHCLLTLYFLDQGPDGVPPVESSFGAGKVFFDHDLGPAKVRIEIPEHQNPLPPGEYTWDKVLGEWVEVTRP
jgi:hypothetical protein